MEKKLYSKQQISHLLDLFMDGTTTLDEEAILAEYFREAKNLPEEWEDFRAMFRYFEDGMDNLEPPSSAKKKSRSIATWAAAILSLFAVAFWQGRSHEEKNLAERSKTEVKQKAALPTIEEKTADYSETAAKPCATEQPKLRKKKQSTPLHEMTSEEDLDQHLRILQAKIDSEIAKRQAELYLADYYAEQIANGEQPSLQEAATLDNGGAAQAIMTLIMP